MTEPAENNFARTQKLILDQHKSSYPKEVKGDLIKLILQSFDNQAKIENEHRERTWREMDESRNVMLKSVLDFGLNALRVAALVSGASLASITGLLPGIEKILKREIPSEVLQIVAAIFCASLVLSVIVSGLAYVTQFFYSASLEYHKKVWDFPYLEYEDKYARYQKIGALWHWATFLTCLLVYGLLGFGFIYLLFSS